MMKNEVEIFTTLYLWKRIFEAIRNMLVHTFSQSYHLPASYKNY